MNIVTRTAAVVGTAAALALPVTLLSATPANAAERVGNCGGARFDFDVERDDDRRGIYDVSFDLDRAADVRYRVVLKQNGNTYYNQVRTPDREGDIEVERNRPNTAGQDRFLFRYKNLASGVTCSRTITVG
ncbi:hypothetical protein [Nocardioides sp. CFH 31398]|uniref:hypothetical protein n=1 Tax=Nocardioides sp. CFH 31398 TaxID=2919579 RepID=UPI001F06E867|nr:hypothetical protein [Nocardioides sp. CFH 31398]MCH1868493.1 hypothetical protein [Nocardioides sp. CFH 31398]